MDNTVVLGKAQPGTEPEDPNYSSWEPTSTGFPLECLTPEDRADADTIFAAFVQPKNHAPEWCLVTGDSLQQVADALASRRLSVAALFPISALEALCKNPETTIQAKDFLGNIEGWPSLIPDTLFGFVLQNSKEEQRLLWVEAPAEAFALAAVDQTLRPNEFVLTHFSRAALLSVIDIAQQVGTRAQEVPIRLIDGRISGYDEEQARHLTRRGGECYDCDPEEDRKTETEAYRSSWEYVSSLKGPLEPHNQMFTEDPNIMEVGFATISHALRLAQQRQKRLESEV